MGRFGGKAGRTRNRAARQLRGRTLRLSQQVKTNAQGINRKNMPENIVNGGRQQSITRKAASSLVSPAAGKLALATGFTGLAVVGAKGAVVPVAEAFTETPSEILRAQSELIEAQTEQIQSGGSAENQRRIIEGLIEDGSSSFPEQIKGLGQQAIGKGLLTGALVIGGILLGVAALRRPRQIATTAKKTIRNGIKVK